MSASVFDNKLVMPDDKMMQVELGGTFKWYVEICQFIAKEYGSLTPEWKFYNQKSGWTLKLFHKKRNILFIGPRRGFFNVAMVFGDRAVDSILVGDFPDEIKKELITGKKYPEGRAIRKEIRTSKDAELIKKLICIKIAN
jgi:hypothetical protein